MENSKPKTVYHKIEILMGGKAFKLWIDCNDDFVKTLCQKHDPKNSIELKDIINAELGREAALIV